MEFYKIENNENEVCLTMGHNGVFFEVQATKPITLKWVSVLGDLAENEDGMFTTAQIDNALLVCLHQCEEHGAKIFLHDDEDENENTPIDFATLLSLINGEGEASETETTIEFNPDFVK